MITTNRVLFVCPKPSYWNKDWIQKGSEVWKVNVLPIKNEFLGPELDRVNSITPWPLGEHYYFADFFVCEGPCRLLDAPQYVQLIRKQDWKLTIGQQAILNEFMDALPSQMDALPGQVWSSSNSIKTLPITTSSSSSSVAKSEDIFIEDDDALLSLYSFVEADSVPQSERSVSECF